MTDNYRFGEVRTAVWNEFEPWLKPGLKKSNIPMGDPTYAKTLTVDRAHFIYESFVFPKVFPAEWQSPDFKRLLPLEKQDCEEHMTATSWGFMHYQITNPTESLMLPVGTVRINNPTLRTGHALCWFLDSQGVIWLLDGMWYRHPHLRIYRASDKLHEDTILYSVGIP